MAHSNLTPGWRINETATAGRENLDAAHVQRYDSKEDAQATAEVDVLARVGVGTASTVVEFGAGTGQFTIEAARRFGSVVAVDVSSVMLDRLRHKLNSAEIDNVDVVEAGFVSYEHHGPQVDAVYSRFALHHLPDFWKAIAICRIRQMLEPGAVLRLWDVVYDFEPDEAEERIEAWCSTAGATIGSEWARWELEEHVRDEHSTFAWLLEAMFERSGFAVVSAEHTEDGIFAKYLLEAV